MWPRSDGGCPDGSRASASHSSSARASPIRRVSAAIDSRSAGFSSKNVAQKRPTSASTRLARSSRPRASSTACRLDVSLSLRRSGELRHGAGQPRQQSGAEAFVASAQHDQGVLEHRDQSCLLARARPLLSTADPKGGSSQMRPRRLSVLRSRQHRGTPLARQQGHPPLTVRRRARAGPRFGDGHRRTRPGS